VGGWGQRKAVLTPLPLLLLCTSSEAVLVTVGEIVLGTSKWGDLPGDNVKIGCSVWDEDFEAVKDEVM
jgi:hypothetical protein